MTWWPEARCVPTVRSPLRRWVFPMRGPPSSTGTLSGQSKPLPPSCSPARSQRHLRPTAGAVATDRTGPGQWNVGSRDAAQKLLERQVAHEIREHQLQWGSTPAGWQRWADQILEPTVRWQQVLAAAVRRGVADVAGRVDFSYRKPSRRSSVSGDVILPSLRQPLPKVAMVLDTPAA